MRRSDAWIAAVVLAAATAAACGGGRDSAASKAGASEREPRDPRACSGCHLPEYRSAPDHVGKKPTTCAVCHATTTWDPAPVDHGFWPLTGAHVKTACFACHVGEPPVFEGTAKDCVGCHRKDYERAPDHVGRRPTTCEQCHTTDAWKPAHEAREGKDRERRSRP